MKTIRPQNNTPTKKQLLDEMVKFDQENNLIDEKPVIISRHDEELIDDNTGKDQTIENLMDEIIKQKDDKVQVTISLTKRQYDLYLKKGAESWLKKALVGQGKRKK